MIAFFEGLVVTEEGQPVEVSYLGAEAYYVIDDEGFRRHVEAREIDLQVLEQFAGQLAEHSDEASTAMLKLLGHDDLFTKAMVDSTIRNPNLEQALEQGLPAEARQWLGLMGLRIVIDVHGEIVRIDMPTAPAGYDEE